jgi:hypothetical protein
MKEALISVDDDKWYLSWEVDTSKEMMEEIDRVSEDKKEVEGPNKPETSSQPWRRKEREKEREEKGNARLKEPIVSDTDIVTSLTVC